MTLFVILKWKFENFWNLYHIWCFSLVWYRFVLPWAGQTFYLYHMRIFLLIWYKFLLLWVGTSFHLYHMQIFSLVWYRFVLPRAGTSSHLYHIWNFWFIWYKLIHSYPTELDSRLYEAEYKLRSIQILQYLPHRSRLEAV